MFMTLPQVLKRGEIIDEYINHKHRGIDTVTIAAPVVINGTVGYVAAVKVSGKIRYHVHRIFMPDGSEFEFKQKAEPTGAGILAENGNKGSAISPAFIDRIFDFVGNNKRKYSIGKDSSGNSIVIEENTADRIARVAENQDVVDAPVETAYVKFSFKDIELIENGIEDNRKSVSFKTAPNVIGKGKIIDYEQNRKGGQYDTCSIC